MTPYITVIVTAYNRQEFLKAALESLIAQDAPAGAFEVIVVKNFENAEVDRAIESMGALSIFDNSKALRSFSEEAVKKAKGEILCFLDDDDLFLPNKISTVTEVFRSNPEIDYYHNAIDYIDVEGNVIAPPFSFRFSILERDKGTVVMNHEEIRM
ncbi:MAG: glycosyltransferase family A protein, partial [Methanomassiliicoccales archaeon]|nr:glycosyltransferase family A protein [Methanomassiliicoccales archaeon]